MISQGCQRSPAGWGQWPYGKPAAQGAQEDGPGCRSSTPSPPAQQGERSHHPCKGEAAGSSQHQSLGLWALAGSPQQHSRLLRWRRGSGSQRGGPQACLVADHPSKGRIPQKSQSQRAGGGRGRVLPPSPPPPFPLSHSAWPQQAPAGPRRGGALAVGEGSTRKSQPLPFPHSGKSQRLASYFVLNTGSQSPAEGLGRGRPLRKARGGGHRKAALRGGSRAPGLPGPPGDPPAALDLQAQHPGSYFQIRVPWRSRRGLRAAPRGWKGAPLQECGCFCFVDRALPRCPWQLLVCAVGPFSR